MTESTTPRSRGTVLLLVVAALVGSAGAAYLALAGMRLGVNLPRRDLWFFDPPLALAPRRLGEALAMWLNALAIAAMLLGWALGGLALRRGASFRALVLVGVCWALPLLAGPPLFSPDVYHYTAIGASVQHGVDPFQAGPAVLGHLPSVRGALPFWSKTPTPYSPPFVALLAGLTRLFHEDVVSQVVALRVLGLAAWVTLVASVRSLSLRCGKDPRLGLVVGVINPLVLVSALSAAHNDVLMVALLVPGIVLAMRRHPYAAVLLIALAADVKVTALVGILVVGIEAAARRPGWGARFRTLAGVGVVGVGAFALTVQLSGWGWTWVGNLSVPGKAVLPQSPPAALATVIDPRHPPVDLVRNIATLVAGLLCLALLARLRAWGMARVLAWMLLVLLVLGPAVWPWYLLGPASLFAAAGVRGERRLVVVASVLLSYCSLPGGQPVLALLPRPGVDQVVLGVLAGLLVCWAAWAAGRPLLSRRRKAGDPGSLPDVRNGPAAGVQRGATDPTGRDPAAQWPGDRTPPPQRVLVVTPTYDEAENITRHVEALLALPVHPDVLIVDDGSPDGTAAIVRELGHAHPSRVHLLERSGARGLGLAYLSGFRWALDRHRWDVLVQMDADGSHDPRSVDDLVAGTSSADLVLGSRYVPGGRTVNWPWRRELLSRLGNVYARTVLRLPVRDLTGGFKAWRTDLLQRLDLGSMTTEGFGFQVEATSQALALGARWVEIPVVFADREHGVSKMRAGIASEALRSVWRIRRRTAAASGEAAAAHRPNVAVPPGVATAQKLVRQSRERSSAT